MKNSKETAIDTTTLPVERIEDKNEERMSSPVKRLRGVAAARKISRTFSLPQSTTRKGRRSERMTRGAKGMRSRRRRARGPGQDHGEEFTPVSK